MTPAEAVEAVASLVSAILPQSAGAVTRAVLAAELARLATVDPAVIATLWNPATCPAILLPYLAQGVSVDVWDDRWDEARKRSVIAASPLVHRKKGTRGAVDLALSAFDLESRIIEWWEDDSRRGTFRLEVVYQDGSPDFDPETQGYAIQSVDAAKPKSRVFTTRAILQARGDVYVGGFARTHFVSTAHPFVFSVDPQRATFVAAATAMTVFSATAHPRI